MNTDTQTDTRASDATIPSPEGLGLGASPVRPLPEETYETGEGPRCPFCGTQWTADDASYYDESGIEDECSNCGNRIRIEPCISVSWTTKPIRWANEKLTYRAGNAGRSQ